ncbi:MAG TPA: FAD:protein FMN transferase, partial [Solirubrobacteraceae bacterium]|nr:FAD:protein FMN transferase [Solirubrobacteraceae bacterium]
MREVRDVMGMPVAVDVRDGAADPELAFAWLREVDAVFSTYREDSEIRRLDRGELALADCRPEVDEVLSACLALGRETGGYFSARPAGR